MSVVRNWRMWLYPARWVADGQRVWVPTKSKRRLYGGRVIAAMGDRARVMLKSRTFTIDTWFDVGELFIPLEGP